VWTPPRLYVCSEQFPPEARIAVRTAPSQDGEVLASLPHGCTFDALGRCGPFLQFYFSEGTRAVRRLAYVPYNVSGIQVLVCSGEEAQRKPQALPDVPLPAAASMAVAASEGFADMPNTVELAATADVPVQVEAQRSTKCDVTCTTAPPGDVENCPSTASVSPSDVCSDMPSLARFTALEARIEDQQRQISALQQEVITLQAHLWKVGAGVAPWPRP